MSNNVWDVHKACLLGIQVLEPGEFIRILPPP